MASASGSAFANRTLVGNWYEDRLDTKKAEIDPVLARTGKFSETPIKMNGPVDPDMWKSTAKLEHSRFEKPPPADDKKMVSLATIHHTIDQTAAPGVLPRHVPGHDARMFGTTTHTAYGGIHADDADMRVLPPAPSTDRRAGKTSFEVAQVAKGVRSGFAAGERPRVGDSDPKEHSFVQRAWLYDRSATHHIARTRDPSEGVPAENIPGLALKGLGTQSIRPRDKEHFPLGNDSLKAETGIWSG